VLLGSFLEQSQRLAEFERKHFSGINIPSVETRLGLQVYLRWLAFASGALFVSFFLISLEILQEASFYVNLSLAFLVIMGGLIVAAAAVVRDREKTAYYIERFSGELRDYLARVGPIPDLDNLEKALNSYQSLFTYCRIPNLRKRLAQIRLALDRGTKQEIKELGKSFRILSKSMGDRDPSLFDFQFNQMVVLLDKIETEKKDIGEIVASRRDRAKSAFNEMKKPFLTTVLPTLIILMLVYLISVLTGHKITLA
jgi:hypothetical protein